MPGRQFDLVVPLPRQGPERLRCAVVQMPEPVKKFPLFVACLVRRLKVLCPTMGKTRIAHVLCRAGLNLSATTVGRMLKERPRCRAVPGLCRWCAESAPRNPITSAMSI